MTRDDILAISFKIMDLEHALPAGDPARVYLDRARRELNKAELIIYKQAEKEGKIDESFTYDYTGEDF